MVHRWGLGTRVGRRAVEGAATALALVALQTGAALADDPAPSAPAPDGDAFAADYTGPDPAAGLPLVDLSLDPAGDVAPPDAPAPADPGPPADPGLPASPAGPPEPSPVVLAGGVVELTTCALAVVACPPPGPARLVWGLLPCVLGAPDGLPAPPVPPMPTAPPAAPAADQPLSDGAGLYGGDGAAPALDAVGLVLRTAGRSTAAMPASVPAANPASPPAVRDGATPGLASTGTPVVAALAGLVLLAVGGCLTWARSRS